jgi:homoserine dehydrogenase
MIKVGLLGLGTVGAGTAAILLDRAGRHHLLQELEIVKVAVRDRGKARSVDLPDSVAIVPWEEIVADPEIDIVVEVMGGLEPARSAILKAIECGKHVVTANKAVISRYGDEIFSKANAAGTYVMLEAAVGGGIPIIQPLKQSLGVNRIQRVTGIVNGTTNYILTRMTQEGGEFADILADAQKLGYAEADPTADVDGWDAADKIAILASLAFGGRIDREKISAEGIRNVTATDIDYAEKLGFTIKLLAIAERQSDNTNVSVRVHPTFLPKGHPLAGVNGVYNAILVEGEPLGQVMFFGPGAGAGATASAVVSDLMAIVGVIHAAAATREETVDSPSNALHPLLSCHHQHYCSLAPLTALQCRYYARFLTTDVPGVIGKLGTVFGLHRVSLESIVQIGLNDRRAEIVVVTQSVNAGDFNTALDVLKALPEVESVPSVFRVV